MLPKVYIMRLLYKNARNNIVVSVLLFISLLLFSMTRRLRNEEIEGLLMALENVDISEDEEDICDENDIDYYPNIQDIVELDNESPESPAEASPVEPTPGPSSAPSVPGILGIVAWRSRSRELLWKKRNLVWNEDLIAFLGSPELADLETPYHFFFQIHK